MTQARWRESLLFREFPAVRADTKRDKNSRQQWNFFALINGEGEARSSYDMDMNEFPDELRCQHLIGKTRSLFRCLTRWSVELCCGVNETSVGMSFAWFWVLSGFAVHENFILWSQKLRNELQWQIAFSSPQINFQMSTLSTSPESLHSRLQWISFSPRSQLLYQQQAICQWFHRESSKNPVKLFLINSRVAFVSDVR